MKIPRSQKGLALLVLVFILALAAIGYAVHATDSTGIQNDRNKKTVAALAEAKAALLGSVIGVDNVTNPAYLPNPDLASPPSNDEGDESLAFGDKDYSLVGKLPWKSLDISPLKDGWNECLWYVVSGRFKKSPSTSIFNWDTQGQIDVIDSNGDEVARNLAALIIAPGSALISQNRSILDPNNKYSQCKGNYDPRNYLDTYIISNAIKGKVNYFSESSDNRKASNTNNKTFVLANNIYYNDKFVYITVDDIFGALYKRIDFEQILNAKLNSIFTDFLGLTGAPLKSADNQNFGCFGDSFCENWKEMLLFFKFSSSRDVVIDGVTKSCEGIVIFGGSKTTSQNRVTLDHKRDPANYLEGNNLIAFKNPGNDNVQFGGVSSFDRDNPSLDVIKCL